MAAITIVQPAGPRLPPHPQAAIRAENGYTLWLRFAPEGVDIAGIGVVWSPLERPGRRPLVARTSDGLPTISYNIVLGHPNHQQDIELEVRAIRELAQSGMRVTMVNLSPSEAGPWRIDDLGISASLRQHGTNRLTRAIATLRLVAASDVDSQATLLKRYTLKSPTAPVVIKIAKGMTLASLATLYYGDPYHWQPIYDFNKLKSNTLKVGKKLTIPVIPV